MSNRLIYSSSAFLLLTLPWLNPFSFGPTSAVVPWLISIVCFSLALWIGFATASNPICYEEMQGWTGTIAGAWMAAALISAVVGLVQYFGASTALAPWVNGAVLGEAYGNLRQRNQFATLMAIGLAALVWWVIQGGSWRGAGVAAAILALGSVASSSRTGLLQWVLLIGVATQFGGGRRTFLRRVLLIAALVYAAASYCLPWLAGLDPLSSGALTRLRSGDDACTGRLTLWSNVLQLIAQKPWFGWGWGELDYGHFITLYPGTRFCDILDNAHNLPLHLAVELGVPASMAICGTILWIVQQKKPWFETDPTRQLAWVVLGIVGLHSLLEYPLWYGPFQIAVCLSLLLLVQPKGVSTSRSVRNQSKRLTFLGCLLVIIVMVCYAGWDYWRVSQLYMVYAERSSAYRENTLEKLRGSWLFSSQVQFAELTTMQPTPATAGYVFDLARHLLHFSPEPRVVERLIESAVMLGREDDAAFYLARYRAAFPEAYAQWHANSTRNETP